jgi:hypothetical protein
VGGYTGEGVGVADRIFDKNAYIDLGFKKERQDERRNMRTGALVLGIIAGLAGLLSAVFALVVGGLGGAFEAEGASTVVGLGWSALGFSLLGLVGAALSLAKPVLAAVIMLVAAIAIAISISLFAVIATPLFLIAALLAFLGRNTRQEEITVQTRTRT